MDDFQFVSFIWGAAQFINGHDVVAPKAISDYEKAEELKADYHFLLVFITSVKSRPDLLQARVFHVQLTHVDT